MYQTEDFSSNLSYISDSRHWSIIFHHIYVCDPKFPFLIKNEKTIHSHILSNKYQNAVAMYRYGSKNIRGADQP